MLEQACCPGPNALSPSCCKFPQADAPLTGDVAAAALLALGYGPEAFAAAADACTAAAVNSFAAALGCPQVPPGALHQSSAGSPSTCPSGSGGGGGRVGADGTDVPGSTLHGSGAVCLTSQGSEPSVSGSQGVTKSLDESGSQLASSCGVVAADDSAAAVNGISCAPCCSSGSQPPPRPPCLADLFSALHALLCTLPPTSDTLRVVYEQQRSGLALGADTFQDHPAWAEQRLAAHLAYLRGAAAPQMCPEEELFKCRTCAFAGACHGSDC